MKNVSGILSKCDVISQLAPHIDSVEPINAITKDMIGNFIFDFSRYSFDIVNCLNYYVTFINSSKIFQLNKITY